MSLNILCSTPVVNMKFARAPLQVCLPPPPSRVTARQGLPQTFVPPRATAVSLQGGLVSETIYEGRNSFIFFTYFFKFFTYYFMFPTYFYMFFTYSFIFSYFPHIPSYFSHIPSWGHIIDLQQEISLKFSKSLKSGGRESSRSMVLGYSIIGT